MEIPKTIGGDKLYNMFLDPSGRHLIISMMSGDVYYVSRNSKQAKALPRLRVRTIFFVLYFVLLRNADRLEASKLSLKILRYKIENINKMPFRYAQIYIYLYAVIYKYMYKYIQTHYRTHLKLYMHKYVYVYTVSEIILYN